MSQEKHLNKLKTIFGIDILQLIQIFNTRAYAHIKYIN